MLSRECTYASLLCSTGSSLAHARLVAAAGRGVALRASVQSEVERVDLLPHSVRVLVRIDAAHDGLIVVQDGDSLLVV